MAGSETVILELNDLSATNHNGGAIHFGPDGKLYVAVGENANSANSQTLTNRLGKLLRINADGTIPSDNPTSFPGIAGSPSGDNQAIWAVGLRNPFTFGFQPGTGRLFINDVGETTWEEINDGIAGSNYGWGICEGFCSPPNANYRDPLFEYGHGSSPTTGCAIVGGAFYNPAITQFPVSYVGKYFFGDLCSGWIRLFDPSNSTASAFAAGISTLVDLKVGPEGSLYYLTRGNGGQVWKIRSTIPTPTPTVTPTPITISGTISYCSASSPRPVPNVTLALTGSASGSTLSDGSGNYTFASLPSGGNYVVTPTKTALTAGSPGINLVDVLAVQRHFLNIALLPPGCRRDAADVNGDANIQGVDALAIQKFFLGMTSGTANTGKYQFTPVNRSYPGVVSNQSGQNYATLVFGDVASGFVERLGGPSQDALGDDGLSAGEVPATVAAVALPEVAVDQLRTPKAFASEVLSRVESKSNFIAAVRTSAIDAKNKLVGFQGDFTFDERVVTFQSEPVQKAGITGGNWNVSGNVLPGTGPIRTLRISAFSNDFTALSGSGTLFELRMTRVSQAAQGTQLLWAAPPDHFIFIDADLKTQKPGYAAPGSVNPRLSQR